MHPLVQCNAGEDLLFLFLIAVFLFLLDIHRLPQQCAFRQCPALRCDDAPCSFEDILLIVQRDFQFGFVISFFIGKRDNHTHHNQLQDIIFPPCQPCRLILLNAVGYNDSVMIADLAVIDDSFIQGQLFAGDLANKGHAFGKYCGDFLQTLRNQRLHVFCEIAAVGTGIGDELVLLIETLRDVQCFLGSVAEAAVAFPLQLCQIKQQRTILRFFAGIQSGDRAVLSRQLPGKGCGLFFLLQTILISPMPQRLDIAEMAL